MLKSYFDASGKGDTAPFITLSGIAANDDLWAEVEANWNHILQAGTLKAAYMHMNEAAQLKREFDKAKGWDDSTIEQLVNALLSYVTTIPTERYCQFYCTIDMSAYRKLQAETYQMDSPVDICITSCVERVMFWYLHEYKGLDVEASYFFDQGEEFEPVFKAKWEHKLKKEQELGLASIWSHIKQVGTLNMRTTPGLQIADMLAWGNNREVTLGKTHQHLALALRALTKTKWIKWEESNLKKRYRPLIHKPW